VKFVFLPIGNRLLPTLQQKKTWTEASRQDRINRFGTVCFKLMYFIVVTIAGWKLLSRQCWFPRILGGEGDVREVWSEYPYPPIVPGLKHYYLIQLAYHVQSLIFHLWMPRRNDYIEMNLHHSCAIFLVLFSYFNNYVRIGSLVLFVHDIADVVGYSVKASVDTNYTRCTLGLYGMLLIVWAVTRLYVFPFYILHTVLFDGVRALPPEFVAGYHCMEAMLYILQCLHIYWYCLFVIMGYQYVKTGQTVDTQQRAGAQFDKKEQQPELVFLDKQKNDQTDPNQRRRSQLNKT